MSGTGGSRSLQREESLEGQKNPADERTLEQKESQRKRRLGERGFRQLKERKRTSGEPTKTPDSRRNAPESHEKPRNGNG